jgi:hypothetical protein
MRRISEKNHDPSAKFDTILSKLKKELKKAIPKAKQKGIDEMDDLMPTTLMYVSLNVMHNILKNMAKENNHPTEDFSQLMSASMIAEGVFDRIDTDTKIFIMEFIEEVLKEGYSRMNQIPSRAMDVDIDIDFVGSRVSESFRKMIREAMYNEVSYPKDEAEKAAKELLSTPVGKKYIPLVKQKEDALSAIDGVKKNDKKYADLKTALDKAEKAEKDYRIKHILSHPLLVNEPKKPAKTLYTTVYNQAKAM